MAFICLVVNILVFPIFSSTNMKIIPIALSIITAYGLMNCLYWSGHRNGMKEAQQKRKNDETDNS